MRRLVMITLCILMLIIAVPGCNLPGRTDISESINLHETPMTYVLIGEDAFSSMPTVTLYKNGNARLSQPPISSLYLAGLGHYQVSRDELIVTYTENASTTFAISDGGDTLTLTDSNIGFTKIGAVYQYRSKTDYYSKYSKIDGAKLTLELVRELAKKAQALTFADFAQYAHVDLDPDYHIFDIEGAYTLSVIYYAEGNTESIIERNSSGENFTLNLNGSTGLVFDEFLGIGTVPNYQTSKWLDYYRDENLPWDASFDLSLPEFPGVTFTWTAEKITADGNDLILGMPVWNAYLTDLSNDGNPEFCATVSIGSGLVDTRVVVYDYAKIQEYQLADRMHFDYHLSMQDGKIMVTQTEYPNGKPLISAELQLINGEIAGFD